MQREDGFRRRLRSTFLRSLAGAILAIKHVGASDLVILAAHQRQFDLVLDILDMECAALAGAACQRRHHLVGQPSTISCTRRDAAGGVSLHGEERLRHGDRDLPRIERRDTAIAADDLMARLAGFGAGGSSGRN